MEHNDPMNGAEQPKKTPYERLNEDIARHTQALKTCKHEVTGRELLSEPDTGIKWLVENVLHAEGIACLAGSSDTGKSAILRQLAEDICAGADSFLGFKLHIQHRSVIYVSTEDGREATRTLLHRQTARYRQHDFANLRFMFQYEDLLGTLDQNLQIAPADLVIIDCFSDLFRHDLKDTHKIREFLQPWQDLAEEHHCHILFLHHTGKRTEDLVPNKNNFLGGQGFEAKMRLGIELRKDHHRPQHRHLCMVKGNYLPEKDKTHSHVLYFCPDTLTFTHTGERVHFEQLSRGYELEESKAKWEQAKDLKEAGKSYAEIAEMMGMSSKSSIARLFEKAKKNGWDDPDREADAEE